MTVKADVTPLYPQKSGSADITSNPGQALDRDWIASVRVNRSAVERRCASLGGRRTVKKDWQAAWLLRAMTCIDLTTLDGADTPGNVQRLCAKARIPLRADIARALQVEDLRVGAVCVYPALVGEAVNALQGTDIPVASVAAGFPDGLTTLATRVAEVESARQAGAREIDIVIRRGLHKIQGLLNQQVQDYQQISEYYHCHAFSSNRQSQHSNALHTRRPYHRLP